MEFEFTVAKRRHRATRERVIEAMRDVEPEPPTPYMVEIEGTAYPMRQALSETFGVDRKLVGTVATRHVFERLGFKVTECGRMAVRPCQVPVELPKPPVWRPRWRPGMAGADLLRDVIELPTLVLWWSYYERWEAVDAGLADGEPIELPPGEPGVYQVVGTGCVGDLYIGRANNLRTRVRSGLVAGTSPHAAGQKMRENENLADLRIRWAATDRPAAVEEELHRLHVELFGRLPKYSVRT